MSTFGINPTYFPAQKKTDAEKNEKWFKECVDVGVGISQWNQNSLRSSSVRQSRKNKIINYNLRNDIVDRNEVERVINPYKLEGQDFPETYRNYPLMNPAVNLLSGEERKRIFTPMVTVINSDAITQKLQDLNEQFDQIVIESITNQQYDEEKTKQRIQEYDKFRKYTYKDKRERMGNQVLKYLYKTQDLDKEFSRGFEDGLIGAEEIYATEIIGGEPTLRKMNPLNVYTLRSGGSPFIEDSDIIVEDGYMPIGKVIDRYHDMLTSIQIDYLESGHNTHVAGNSAMFSEQLLNSPNIGSILPDVQVVDNWNAISGYYNGAFDPEGNVRVIRVLWRGLRQVKIITSYNEAGEEIKDIMPEQYKPNKELGEEVKVEWWSEWYEGTRVGADTYLKMQPCEIQMRHRDNPSICSPGVVGIVYNVNTNVGRSLFDEGRDLQYLYNLFMYRTELAFTKYKGKIGKLPLHLIPDGMSMDKWLYYAETMGWAIVDAFNESNKAAFRGKPAGGFQEGASVLDLEMGNYIQNHIQMLSFIETRLDNLIGITPQRKGSIDNRETKGGVEIAVTQSSNITEKWFSIHDHVRKRALRALLEAAKIAWQGKSFVREFVLDNGTKELLDFDYDVYCEASYGVDVTDASEDMQTLQAIRNLGERFVQGGGALSVIMDLYRTKNIGDSYRRLQAWEEQQAQIQADSIKAEQEQLAAKAQQEQDNFNAELQFKYDELEQENENKELDRQAKIEEETIIALGMSKVSDADNNGQIDVLEQNKLALDHLKHSHEVSIKEREQRLKEKTANNELKLKERELKLKEKELVVKKQDSNNKLKIAKANKNKYSK